MTEPNLDKSVVNWKRRGRLAAAIALLALGGCATAPQATDPRDPLEPANRKVTAFNEAVDNAFLKPVAIAYRDNIPPVARTGVSNFFGNLTDVWSAVNSLLQLEVDHAAENLMRFNVNTVFGLGGLLDIASDANLERHREDFGQTLGRWGMHTGPYIVLPLLGPSTLRDTMALPVDWRADPVRYADPAWRNGLSALRIVNARANLLRVSSVLDEAALDKYTFTRDAHLQRRQAEVLETNGRGKESDGSEPPLPEPATPAPQQPAR
jgi:phospholipid-binding lipoprotein MlaA